MSWLGEKKIYEFGTYGAQFVADINPSTITRGETSVRVRGTVRLGARNAQMWYANRISCSVNGSSVGTIKGQTGQGIIAGTNYDAAFDVTISVSSSATSATLTAQFDDEQNASSGWVHNSASWTISFDPGYSDPEGLSISLASVSYNGAYFNVSVSSYGVPASASGRYIEAQVGNAGGSSNYRYSNSKNVSSVSNLWVGNDSGTISGGVTISGNTRYAYRGYATNTVKTKTTGWTNFVTTCPPLSALSVSSQSANSSSATAVMAYTRQNDGGYYPATLYYRYQQNGTWSSWQSAGTAVSPGSSGTFTITGLTPGTTTTVEAKLTTTAGDSPSTFSNSFVTYKVPTISSITATNPGVYRINTSISGIDWGVGATSGSHSIRCTVAYTLDGVDYSTSKTFTASSSVTSASWNLNGLTETPDKPWANVPDDSTARVTWTVETSVGSATRYVDVSCQTQFEVFVIDPDGTIHEAEMFVSPSVGSKPTKEVRRITSIL